MKVNYIFIQNICPSSFALLSLTGRLNVDLELNVIYTTLVQSVRVSQRLAHGLNRKVVLTVPDSVQGAVNGTQADSEEIRGYHS